MSKPKQSKAATPEDPPIWCSFTEMVAVADMRPNPRNPNTHPQRQIELLAQNIKHFGWRHPITVSIRSGMIVAGHGRLLAAQKLGLTHVPVDYQNFASEDDEIAILVADNRLAELSTLDLNELEKIAKEWTDKGFDPTLAGFDPSDLDALLTPEQTPPADGEDEHGELEKGKMTVAIGMYRFHVTQEEFAAWADGLRQKAGFDKAAVLAVIRERLGL